MASKRTGRGRAVVARRGVGPGRLQATGASLDAEDIALARLQAHLRKAETIHAPARSGVRPRTRTTVRLPREMLQRVRERARREGLTLSDVVEVALERYLRSPGG